jgi:cytosine/adenosine deaminase-related metal-dependent hydrolase
MCCTTERDLADGVGPAVQLAAAGAPLCVGSDSHAVIDLWEEARAIELDERLVTGRRGHLRAGELASALTANGAASIGGNAGRLAVGALADLVTVRLDSPRTAGADSGDALAHVLFAGTAADVSSVVVAGRLVVEDGQHAAVEDVGKALQSAVAACLAD